MRIAGICVFFLPFIATAQNLDFYPGGWHPDEVHKGRKIGVMSVGLGGYALGMTGLYALWYSDHEAQSFSTFDDNAEWEGVDKIGHIQTGFYLAHLGHEALWWAGMSNKKSAIWGSIYSVGFMTTIEVFDGFSTGYGFSWGDIAANTLGTGLFLAQQLTWKEQRFQMKFSYHATEYAQYRPELLGSSWNERLLKDYNGHTYWLSMNLSSFMRRETRFPKWLNVAVGYGAEGMLGGHENPVFDEETGEPYPEFERYRKGFLSLDVDLKRIKTRSKFLKGTFIVLSFIKIPFPTLEVNSRGKVIFHPIYF
jgi:uncharacterized protein YfiM (DUF2279 family)